MAYDPDAFKLEDLVAKIELYKAVEIFDLFVGDKEKDLETAEEIRTTYFAANNRGYKHDEKDRKLVNYTTDLILKYIKED